MVRHVDAMKTYSNHDVTHAQGDSRLRIRSQNIGKVIENKTKLLDVRGANTRCQHVLWQRGIKSTTKPLS